MTADQLRECPFCGGTSIGVREGSTFRWRVAFCNQCEATCSEIRHDTMADDQEAAERDSHQRAIDEWNTRPTAVAPHAEGEELTDDDVERLSLQAGWEGNRKYMTKADFHIWCDRMRAFAALVHPPRSGDEARDAARYRWLRENIRTEGRGYRMPEAGTDQVLIRPLHLRFYIDTNGTKNDTLDQAIDAAMAARGGENKQEDDDNGRR